MAGVVLLWAGFHHYWERHAAVGLHLPHRVSLFESRVEPGEHTPTPEGWASASTFTFAQSTGVDGDWMFPEGYVTRVASDDLSVTTGTEVLTDTDHLGGGEHPKALVRFERILSIPRPEMDHTTVAVLQGLSFRSWCIDEGDGCNSDGIWPYRFEVALAACSDVGDTVACPVSVVIGRGWTPGRGGIRGVEEKPVEPHMGLEVQVHWAVLSTPADRMLAHPWVYENALPSTGAMVIEPQVMPVDGLPVGFPAAAVALNSLAFEFFPPSRREPRQDRGRYIGGWGVQVGVDRYDAATGHLDVAHAGGIWLPRTVHRTAVKIEVGAVLLQLADPNAEVRQGTVARGSLCSPSDGAPWFSRWDRCDRHVGAERREVQNVPIRIDPSEVHTGG